MSDSQKPPREWWLQIGTYEDLVLEKDDLDFGEAPADAIHVIERSAYDQLMQQALAMREALCNLANHTGLEWCQICDDSPQHCGLGDARQALEQFDAFMRGIE